MGITPYSLHHHSIRNLFSNILSLTFGLIQEFAYFLQTSIFALALYVTSIYEIDSVSGPRIMPLQGLCLSKDYASPRIMPLQGLCLSKDYASPRIMPLQGLCLSQDYASPRIMPLPGLCLSQDYASPCDVGGARILQGAIGLAINRKSALQLQ